jgi:hypothetical protein
MDKTTCKACSATVEQSLEFCSSCGEWLGISLNDLTEEKVVSEKVDRRNRIPQLRCPNCSVLNSPSSKYCKECNNILVKPLSSYGATSLPTRKEVPGIRAVFFLAIIIPLIAGASYYYNQNVAEEVIEEVQVVQQSTTTSSTTTVPSILKVQFPFSCKASRS